jgi:hypothetical protein
VDAQNGRDKVPQWSPIIAAAHAVCVDLNTADAIEDRGDEHRELDSAEGVVDRHAGERRGCRSRSGHADERGTKSRADAPALLGSRQTLPDGAPPSHGMLLAKLLRCLSAGSARRGHRQLRCWPVIPWFAWRQAGDGQRMQEDATPVVGAFIGHLPGRALSIRAEACPNELRQSAAGTSPRRPFWGLVVSARIEQRQRGLSEFARRHAVVARGGRITHLGLRR